MYDLPSMGTLLMHLSFYVQISWFSLLLALLQMFKFEVYVLCKTQTSGFEFQHCDYLVLPQPPTQQIGRALYFPTYATYHLPLLRVTVAKHTEISSPQVTSLAPVFLPQTPLPFYSEMLLVFTPRRRNCSNLLLYTSGRMYSRKSLYFRIAGYSSFRSDRTHSRYSNVEPRFLTKLFRRTSVAAVV